eukprot:3266088-Lingulodinium_polyedra.AAC.1
MGAERREQVAPCGADEEEGKRGGHDSVAKRPKGSSDAGTVRSGTSGGVAYPPSVKACSNTGSSCWDDAGPADRAAGASSPVLVSE